jgi:hypothetical protein
LVLIPSRYTWQAKCLPRLCLVLSRCTFLAFEYYALLDSFPTSRTFLTRYNGMQKLETCPANAVVADTSLAVRITLSSGVGVIVEDGVTIGIA